MAQVNLWVSHAVPTPIPMVTHTCDQCRFCDPMPFPTSIIRMMQRDSTSGIFINNNMIMIMIKLTWDTILA